MTMKMKMTMKSVIAVPRGITVNRPLRTASVSAGVRSDRQLVRGVTERIASSM